MPNLTFVMPHWLYWAGLVVFPLFAMAMVRRTRRRPDAGGVSLWLGYIFLVTAGFVGVHRYYLRSWIGVLYLPLSAGILFANGEFRLARNVLSEARHGLMGADFMVERFAKAVTAGTEGAAARLATAKQALIAARQHIAEATARHETWDAVAMWLALAILAFLVIDAVLLPRMTRVRAEIESRTAATPSAATPSAATTGVAMAAAPDGSVIVRAIGGVSGWMGYFICYWSLIAVFVYYYEVLARYIFNSPTNWAHESMFLMFGMQYLIAGAFALREDSHVRVDVIYTHLGERWKALVDVVTSLFFFLFSGALLVTGWIFARDSIDVWEVSFTEWAIQYWPVKSTIVLGALLLILQGVAKLIGDVRVLTARRA